MICSLVMLPPGLCLFSHLERLAGEVTTTCLVDSLAGVKTPGTEAGLLYGEVLGGLTDYFRAVLK